VCEVELISYFNWAPHCEGI